MLQTKILNLSLIATLLAATAASALAQAPAEGQQKRKPPMGYIRVWHFAPSIKRKISVSLVGPSPRPVILGRALVPSDMLNYRELPPGQYKLSIRAAADDLNVTEASPEVLPPVTLNVADKGFQTVILQDDGAAKILVANDSTIGAGLPKGAKRLRIFDFAPGQDASLKTSPNNEVIAPHLVPGVSEHIFPSSPGALMLLMSNKLRNGHEAEQTVEANFASVDSISAIVMFDAYGRLTLRSLEDAKAD